MKSIRFHEKGTVDYGNNAANLAHLPEQRRSRPRFPTCFQLTALENHVTSLVAATREVTRDRNCCSLRLTPVCILPPVCSLQSPVCVLHWPEQKLC